MEAKTESFQARKARLKEQRQEKAANAVRRREIFDAEVRSNYTEQRAIQEMLTWSGFETQSSISSPVGGCDCVGDATSCDSLPSIATTSTSLASGYTSSSVVLLHVELAAACASILEPLHPLMAEKVQKRCWTVG